VVVIAARVGAVLVYRVVVGARGVSWPASRMAKVKTLAQQCAVGFALAPFSAADATWTWGWLLGLAVALTIASGLQYAVRALRPRRAAA
jgi:CDP-diacylglycerol--glycerol-3-phosphate 3-phosphatidyltransferase